MLIRHNALKYKSKSLALLRGFFVLISRLRGNGWARRRGFATVSPYLGYDLAISFAQDNSDKAFAIGCNDFVLQKVEAKKKVAFVHCDFGRYGGNTPKNRETYRKFDQIACVSEGCRKAFLDIMPELEDKTLVVENCTDIEQVQKWGEAFDVPYEEKGFHLVTVSRLNEEKGLMRALNVLSPFLDRYPSLFWHIVGDGPQRGLLEEEVKKKKWQHRIIFYGMQDNPYPYIRQANLFFLPSYHEAAPMVFGEAWALGTPILTTETLSARAMVEERGIGMVCENDENSMAMALEEILSGGERWETIQKEMRNKPISNHQALRQWRVLMEEEMEESHEA